MRVMGVMRDMWKLSTQRVHIVPQMQGLRKARKRSLLCANEHSEPERNAADAVRYVLAASGFCGGIFVPPLPPLRVIYVRRVQGLVLIFAPQFTERK